MLNYIYDARSSAHKHMHHNQRFGPTFETNATSMTVQVGNTATIDCKISLLQDNAVSWVLRKPSEDSLRLLTVGQMTYSGDARHAVEFLYPNNWRLTVQNMTKQDEGMYECQISTHPPKLIRTRILVNVPEVLIVDEKGRPIQDKHYEAKSTIRLSCIVRHVYMTGNVVSWIHQGVLLNQDSQRGGISVKSELREDGAESVLNVARVDKADAGNYTCSISPTHRTTVLVHILDGESMSELHGAAPPARQPHLFLVLALLALSAALQPYFSVLR
ncbi:tapasin-related protein-like [Thrips palmi]|uniref:Tapasin-related protein-like n=1 Tax=Thrips palmi TaxID=161013 RepID=A0A6P8YGC0_THRPL|nr:tapasin-related protein-like [Thrips palmi]